VLTTTSTDKKAKKMLEGFGGRRFPSLNRDYDQPGLGTDTNTNYVTPFSETPALINESEHQGGNINFSNSRDNPYGEFGPDNNKPILPHA